MVELIVGGIVGLIVGLLGAALWYGRRTHRAEAGRQVAEAQLASARELEDRLHAIGTEAIRTGRDDLVAETKREMEPIARLLELQRRAVTDLERDSAARSESMKVEIARLAEMHGALRDETGRLSEALRRPNVRGTWGEMQLRNAVEIAGMSAHCDFVEQPHVANEEGGDSRPDLVVRMPGGGSIVVDAKVPLDAFLDVLAPEADVPTLRRRHADAVRNHVRALSAKTYWQQFEHAPEFVVLFMRLESSLVAALDVRPDLIEWASRRNVLIATPTLIVALLRTAAYGWQQDALARNATEIAEAGSVLFSRLDIFARRLNELGRALRGAGRAFDETVGSFATRLVPSARRLHVLSERSEPVPETPAKVDLDPRELPERDPRVSSPGGSRPVRPAPTSHARVP